MKVVLLNLILVSAVWGSSRLDPLVNTKKGLIRGLQASDGDYSMFMGIPYARVNQSNPFGPSLPSPDFDDVFEAYDDSAICPQVEDFENQIVGSLDCLHLNIYVPNKATTRNSLPVLVWIYGGRFEIGLAGRFLYGPKYLVRNDIILVTINYRLGPYGFMCLDTPEIPGNQGLKDQLSALRWVKDNIEEFGGDVNKITIIGESAGGMSVDFHLHSAQEKLFDKVIMQSGTILSPSAMAEADTRAPMTIAEHLGYEAKDNADALTFLSTVEPKLVIAAVTDLSLKFLPCVEKDFDGVEKLVKGHPINSQIPKAKGVKILSGYNNREMLTWYGNKASGNEDNVFRENLEKIFDLSDNEDLITLVRQFYVGDEDMSADLKWVLMDFESDFSFNHPVHRSLQKYIENDGTVYHYIFSYSGGRNFVKFKNNITEDGAAHADEIGYLFDVSILDTPSDEDQLVIDRITTLWTNFAKYGDPTPETSDLLPVKWTPVEKDVLHYLDIDKELTMKRRPFHDRMAFWDLFFKMNRNLLKAYEGDD
ncbi:unnamed protein product [Parnassius apollo]|uniref:Carboxylic ester hydrolase n=1 Tax=Parnassius apollo TaxID=110799 RepID=A0A8S3WBX8_PARAO|nr:unnamed protein product [Parnassius apollo]